MCSIDSVSNSAVMVTVFCQTQNASFTSFTYLHVDQWTHVPAYKHGNQSAKGFKAC